MELREPSSPEVAGLWSWIDAHQNEIVEAVRGVLRIPSLEGPAEPGAPFGQPVRRALDYTLDLCERSGFRTKDIDGYAGHAEFGQGLEMVAALGHLDVVPEGDGWKHAPYGAEIEHGAIYGRGSSDDKGPTYASLYAAKALMDSGLPLRRRVRLIFGCNEESGFGCVRHYWDVAKEERPLYAFTPDGAFPLVYAEKGIVNLVFEHEREVTAEGDLRIVRASGGRRPNMVPDHAEAEVRGPAEAVRAAGARLAEFWDRNVSHEVVGSRLLVRAIGKNAHGSQPTLGDNAIARLAKALLTLSIPGASSWLEWIAESAESTGSVMGIARTDNVAGPLTSNLGMFEANDRRVQLIYNVRYPVTWNCAELIDANRPVREQGGWKLAEAEDQPPLYVPLDEEPVATLMHVYQSATGDVTSQPETMGGGTYARATPRAVAFGAGFPGVDDGPAHEPDERILISSLLNAAKIYAQAFYELAR